MADRVQEKELLEKRNSDKKSSTANRGPGIFEYELRPQLTQRDDEKTGEQQRSFTATGPARDFAATATSPMRKNSKPDFTKR